MLADPTIDVTTLARSAGTCTPYAAGDTVFREGDPPNFMYVVLSGRVRISSQGREIEELGPGKALGVLSLLDDLPRTATATVMERSEIAAIDRHRLRFMIEETPGFVWYVMGELAHRLRSTNAAL